jgi:hypothetical protein
MRLISYRIGYQGENQVLTQLRFIYGHAVHNAQLNQNRPVHNSQLDGVLTEHTFSFYYCPIANQFD